MMPKMMKMFDLINDNVKEMRTNLSIIGKKEDLKRERLHEILIKQGRSKIQIFESMNHQSDLKALSLVNLIVEEQPRKSIEERMGVEALMAMVMNFDENHIEEYDKMVDVLEMECNILNTHESNWTWIEKIERLCLQNNLLMSPQILN